MQASILKENLNIFMLTLDVNNNNEKKQVNVQLCSGVTTDVLIKARLEAKRISNNERPANPLSNSVYM